MKPEGDRRSGRTARALECLPDGSVYLVAHRPEVEYCRGLLAKTGRKPISIRLVTLAEVPRALMGLPRSTVLDVDHFVFEIATSEQRDLIRIFMHRYRLPPTAPVKGPQGRTAARSGPGAAGVGNSREEGGPEGPPHAKEI